MSFLACAQTLLADVLSLARIRLELFGTELQEELSRLFVVLLCAGIVLLMIALAAGFAGLAFVVVLPEDYRAPAAGVIALVFLALAGLAAARMRRLTRAAPRAFDASLTEMARDSDALRP